MSESPYFIFSCLLLFSCCNGCSGPGNAIAPEQTWYGALPACPCENPDRDGIKPNDGWAKDKGDIATYHTGATECFRSYPPVATREGASGQQCCYDAQGRLITCGSGAGTPDKISTCDGEDENGAMTIRVGGLFGHLNKDVSPWKKMGGQNDAWKSYNLLWPPNNGNRCDTNCVTK